MKREGKGAELLWELWCVGSLLGIWPRYIEPNTVWTNVVKIGVPNLPSELVGFKILHFSDLHLNKGITNYFIRKLLRKVEKLSPDIVVFTGDFLCHSRLADRERLQQILHSLYKAPFGNYAILGNHDYSEYISLNEEGDYDVGCRKAKKSSIANGFMRLFRKVHLSGRVTERARGVKRNEELAKLIESSPFTLLHNRTLQISPRGSHLNICGLGEHIVGDLSPEKAYENYDVNYPGVILLHNPDGIRSLANFPGEVVLCGHTHGGQVNLPWMAKRFIVREEMRYMQGLYREGRRTIYINRGVGGVLNFRWFAPPELTLLELIADE